MAWSGNGAFLAYTLDGPPDRMMPLGLQRGDFRRGRVVAQDDGIHVALADAARDDLRVLRAEIQDDDLLGHCLTTFTFPAAASYSSFIP